MENISLAKDIGDIVTQNAINLSGNLAKSYLAKEIGDIVTQNEINYINLNFIRFYLVNSVVRYRIVKFRYYFHDNSKIR